MTTPKLLSADDVAAVLGLNVQTVRKHTRQGLYPFAVKVGRQWRYDPRRLEKWLESRRNAA
jgi:excisionase family DNA binding protein